VQQPQQASNISIGALGDDGEQQQQQQPVAPVNYAPKDRKQLWKAAIKLPMYSVGVVPVLVSLPQPGCCIAAAPSPEPQPYGLLRQGGFQCGRSVTTAGHLCQLAAQSYGCATPSFKFPLLPAVAAQVGAAVAYYEHSVMPWVRVAGLLLGAICVIAWLNLR
jgi:hypothetical protein